MKVIVTGATSFIAKKFIYEAHNRGWEIVAIVRHNSPKAKEFYTMSNMKVLELEMIEYERIGYLVGKVDCLIHFAWDGTRGNERNNKEIQHQNCINSIKLVQGVLEVGCKKIVMIGSQAEYGVVKGELIKEDMIAVPKTEYGKYKLKTYETCKGLCKEYNSVLIEPRIFSVYGEGDYDNSLVMTTVRKMLNNESCSFTQCDHLWNYLYIDDAVKALISLCEKTVNSGIYNVAGCSSKPLKEYILDMKEELNSESHLYFGALSCDEALQPDLNPDVSKILEEIGWKSEISFRTGIGLVKEKG